MKWQLNSNGFRRMEGGSKLSRFFKRKVKRQSPVLKKVNTYETLSKTVSQLAGVRFRVVKRVPRQLDKFAVIVGLVLALYLVFFSKMFVLDDLKVTGQHLATEEQIRQIVFPSGFKSINATTVPEGHIRSKLKKQLPQIDQVHFRKNIIDNTLTIEIQEHETSIVWMTGGEKYLVNREGKVYDKAPENTPLLAVEDLKNIPISINQRIVSPQFIEFISSFTANLPRRTNISIRRIFVPETTFEVEMQTSEGWKIILDTTGSYDDQLNNLVRILREMPNYGPIKEYVDLRIGKKVYYK